MGRPDAAFPDGGVEWHYTPPCAALDHWPPMRAHEHAPFTTVSHWYQNSGWMEDAAEASRTTSERSSPHSWMCRAAAPRRWNSPCASPTTQPIAPSVATWTRGWRVRDAYAVASTPWDYQRYIQASRGEFSRAKPSYVRLQTAWISDRTLCYLASGKPAIVQHTGPSRVLPADAGLLRFSTPEQALWAIERVAGDYARHSRLARALAEDLFDARKVASRLLELAVG